MKISTCCTAVVLALTTGVALAETPTADVEAALPGVQIVSEARAKELAKTGEARISLPGYAGFVMNNAPRAARLGWELGRRMAPADPGPYPGFLRATGIRK